MDADIVDLKYLIAEGKITLLFEEKDEEIKKLTHDVGELEHTLSEMDEEIRLLNQVINDLEKMN